MRVETKLSASEIAKMIRESMDRIVDLWTLPVEPTKAANQNQRT